MHTQNHQLRIFRQIIYHNIMVYTACKLQVITHNEVIKMAKNNKKLLQVWKEAWENSNMANPLGMQVETTLMKNDMSTYDIRVQLGVIKSKKANDLTKYEIEFLDFWNKTNHIREQILNDRVSTNIAGQIFLLKTQYGYAETQKIETTGNTNVVLDFGSDE